MNAIGNASIMQTHYIYIYIYTHNYIHIHVYMFHPRGVRPVPDRRDDERGDRPRVGPEGIITNNVSSIVIHFDFKYYY